jgi:hypothetical protein
MRTNVVRGSVVTTQWQRWYGAYDDPCSPLSRRLRIVQAHIRTFLDSRADGPIRALSLCAGDGRDLLDVLAVHTAREWTTARLVELDSALAATARSRVLSSRLEHVEVVQGDAGVTDAYTGAIPADLLLLCGVFGNISDADVERTVGALPALVARSGVVVWTRHRRDPDLTPHLRARLADLDFAELAFESGGVGSFAVGVHRCDRPAPPLPPGTRLFAFNR